MVSQAVRVPWKTGRQLRTTRQVCCCLSPSTPGEVKPTATSARVACRAEPQGWPRRRPDLLFDGLVVKSTHMRSGISRAHAYRLVVRSAGHTRFDGGLATRSTGGSAQLHGLLPPILSVDA